MSLQLRPRFSPVLVAFMCGLAATLAPISGSAASGWDVQISTIADAGSVAAGDQLGYVITVTNMGKGNAPNLSVTDILPTNAGLAWSVNPANPACGIASGVLSCSLKLAKKSSFSVHIVSPTSQSTCGEVSNQASVSAKNSGSTNSNTAAIVVACPVHATSLAAASSAGDTNVKVASVSPLGTRLAAAVAAGDTNIKVTSTAPFFGTTLAAASSAGDTNIKVASTDVLRVGQSIDVDVGGSAESAVIQSVGTAGAGGTGVTLMAALASAHANGASVTPAGQMVHVDTGAGEENATIQSVGTSGVTGTGLTLTAPLAEAHASGSQVDVATMSIDQGASQETVTVTSVGTEGAGGTGVSFTPALESAHANGAVVVPQQP